MDQIYVVPHKVLVEGRSAREVAAELGISRNTVRRYVEGAEPGRRPVARSAPALEAVRPRLEALLSDSPRSSPYLCVNRTRSEAPRLLHAALVTTTSLDSSRDMSR